MYTYGLHVTDVELYCCIIVKNGFICKNWGCFPKSRDAWIMHGLHELNLTVTAMIENERLELPDFSLDMDLSPSSILLIPVVARLSLATIQFQSINILFVDPSNAFLFCMALGILTYKTIIHSSLISGIVLGLSSRVVITYFIQGRRWTIICGFLLGVFASDIVTLFWNYVNEQSDNYARDGGRRRKSTRARRLSDPRPPNPAWSSLAGKQSGEAFHTPSDQEVAVLKRRLAQAEATVRRVQEERKWAM